MEKHSLIRVFVAVGSAAALSFAPAVAQASVTLPSGRLIPSVFNEWTQFFDAGTSVAQSRVRLLRSIQGSNRGQVNKWLNQWLHGLSDDEQADEQFADVSDHGPSKQLATSGGAETPNAMPTDNHNSVTIDGISYDLIPPGGDKAFVLEWNNPNGDPDQPMATEIDPPVTVNPEPATLLLLAPGFLTAFVLRRRRRQSVDD